MISLYSHDIIFGFIFSGLSNIGDGSQSSETLFFTLMNTPVTGWPWWQAFCLIYVIENVEIL